MEKLTIDNIVDLEDYADKESFESTEDRIIIEALKKSASNIKDIQGAINALEEIKKIIVKNKNELDDKVNSIEFAKAEINKEIKILNAPNTLNTLFGAGINAQILTICVAAYNLYYARIQELKYRLEILSYKTLFIEEQQEEADEKIELINKYIIALEELL